MTPKSIAPIAAFKIDANARPVSIADAWPDIEPEPGLNYRWLHFDLSDPSLADWLKSNLPPSAVSALLQAETRPRCDVLDEGLILNLRGVNLNPGADPEDMVSLRLWVTKTLIVSVTKRKIWAVDEIRQRMVDGTAPSDVGEFIFELPNGLTRRIEKVSLELEEQTDILEEKMIDQPSGLSAHVSPLRMQPIKLRRFVSPQREALFQLATMKTEVVRRANQLSLRETANRAARTVEELDATRDRLAAIQEHVDAHNAAMSERNGYILSLVAAIFLPLGFLTGLFGVNVGGIPGLESPIAFAILTLISVLIAIALYLIFRLSKWL